MAARDVAATTPAPARLELIGLTRRYPGTLANDSVSLRIRAGEIHAILGENGSGKSTLLRCIYGVERPDDGSVIWNGREVTPASPAAARALGMAMVFQHFSLIEPLTVIENVRLYLQGSPLGEAPPAAVRERLARLSAALDMPLDPSVRVERLSVGERQRIEILRCLLLAPQLLMLDEPTAALTPAETTQLFRVLRRIAADGCSILFVTHRLAEVRDLCERATILRRGRIAGSCAPAAVEESELARLLVGEMPPPLPTTRPAPGTRVRLRLDRLLARPDAGDTTPPAPLSLDVRAGEIVGIAGVAGNGQALLGELVTGERGVSGGRICLDDTDLTQRGPAARYAAGLQVIPAERTHRGAISDLPLQDNLLLTQTNRYAGGQSRFWSRLDRKAAADDSAGIMRDCDVRAPGPHTPAGRLSGGNLQKFLVGRALLSQPRVILCHNPTWGVDILAAAAIHLRLLQARAGGAAILLISADLDEVYHLSDRIAVLYRGRLSSPLPVADLPRVSAGLLMAGAGSP